MYRNALAQNFSFVLAQLENHDFKFANFSADLS